MKLYRTPDWRLLTYAEYVRFLERCVDDWQTIDPIQADRVREHLAEVKAKGEEVGR